MFNEAEAESVYLERTFKGYTLLYSEKMILKVSLSRHPRKLWSKTSKTKADTTKEMPKELKTE